MRSSKGFTLMEIIVVFLIIGVIAGFYFPNFTAPTKRHGQPMLRIIYWPFMRTAKL